MRKLGERILPEIIPILERGLDSDKNDERQGVCIGLSEIVASTSREQVRFIYMSCTTQLSDATNKCYFTLGSRFYFVSSAQLKVSACNFFTKLAPVKPSPQPFSVFSYSICLLVRVL